MNTNVKNRLPEFLVVLNEFVNGKTPPTMRIGLRDVPVARREMGVEFGHKFARITQRDKGSSGCQVYCFVDLNTGDLLKAASWKTPARNGVRGNIFADDFGLSCCDVFGLKYLRR